MRSVSALSEKMGIKSPRLLSMSNQCAIQVMNFASLRALIDRYSGAKADDWREQLDELIQFIWRNSTQVVQLQREKRKTSLILFFVFLDTSDRIRSGPWETMAAGNSVSFIGSQRNRAQPSAVGYLQQWAHYLLTVRVKIIHINIQMVPLYHSYKNIT